MGCERREVTFDTNELDGELPPNSLGFELAREEVVQEWVRCHVGWGWSGGIFDNDFSFSELEQPQICAVEEILNPRTERTLVTPRAAAGKSGKRPSTA